MRYAKKVFFINNKKVPLSLSSAETINYILLPRQTSPHSCGLARESKQNSNRVIQPKQCTGNRRTRTGSRFTGTKQQHSSVQCLTQTHLAEQSSVSSGMADCPAEDTLSPPTDPSEQHESSPKLWWSVSMRHLPGRNAKTNRCLSTSAMV